MGTSLGQSFKPLEGIIDKNPIFIIVRIGATIVIDIIANCRNLQVNVWKFVKIGGIIYGLDFNGNCSRTFANMFPVYALTVKT